MAAFAIFTTLVAQMGRGDGGTQATISPSGLVHERSESGSPPRRWSGATRAPPISGRGAQLATPR
jgi:hypothetical protein